MPSRTAGSAGYTAREMPDQVLVVEDSRAMRQYVRAILEATGRYTVVEVDNGFDALRLLPREAVDLVVTDINLPDVSGIELLRFLRKHDTHARTAVLVISTDASAADIERARQAGASAFLSKPFTGRALLDAIERARQAAAEGQEPR